MKKWRLLIAFIVMGFVFLMLAFVNAIENSTNDQNNQTISCIDSDEGINYYVKGTTHYGKFDYTDWCVTSDSIVNQGQSNEYNLTKGELIEYACKGEDGQSRCIEYSCKFIKYLCPNGCSNGACLKEGCEKVCKNIGTKSEGWYSSCTGELLESASCGSSLCSDSDNGLNIYELGTTRWKVEDGSTNSENDYCIDKNTLSEGVCGKTDVNGKSYRRESYTCPNGCKDGKCIQEISCKMPGCDGAYNTGKKDDTGCYIYTCPSKCEDYSYNQCPQWCEKKTSCIGTCKEGEPCPAAPCQLICATPGQKEVYLNQKFELKSQETAKVVDYKNMEIKYIAMLCTIPSCRENEPCPPTPNPCKLTFQVSISSSEGTGTTTSTIDIGTSSSSTGTIGIGSGGSGTSTVGVGRGGVGTVFDLAPGEKKEVFGASISLLKLERDVAVLVVEEQIIIKPVCGNGICEAGEGEICTVPASSSDIFCEEGKECKTPPSKCNLVCPKDCSKGELIYIELNNKFKLQISQAAILKNESIKITFKNMIASRCKEEVVSSKASAVAIKEKVAEAERTLTGSVVSDLSTDKPLSVLRCVGSGPRALLSFEIEREKGNPIKKGVLELDLKEKKQVGDFTVAFLDHDYASRTGVFLINKEKFECPEKCKCDGEGNTIACPDKKTCDESKVLCPDGECRDKCEIKTTEECKYGCNYESSCFPIGVRSKGLYCGNDLVMNSQKNSEQICENNFECSSNVCVSGKCVSAGLMERVLAWFKRMFGKE